MNEPDLSQSDDSAAILPRTGNPRRGRFADQKAVTGAANIPETFHSSIFKLHAKQNILNYNI